MAPLENRFSWSFSRHKTFLECKRRYFLQYYGSWGGWDPNAPDAARIAYRLKQMIGTAGWVGDLVHRMIERILGDMRNRELNSLENYQAQVRKLMNQEWKQSVDGEWMHRPKYRCNLFEHYYQVEISPEDRLALRDKAYFCLAHFMHSDLFAQLATLRPTEWKSVEKLDTFDVGGVPVYVVLDCASCAESTGILSIYDWKTGKETADTDKQLGCYALYAMQKWHVPLEQIRLLSFYLSDNNLYETGATPEHLVETKDLILTSIRDMQALLEAPLRENRAQEARFPQTTNRSSCRLCNYREICFQTRRWPILE